MLNRLLRAASLALVAITVAACSGGSPAGTSKVTLKFGSASGSATVAKTVFAGVTTATEQAPLPSIVKKIIITVSAPDMTTISREIPITFPTMSAAASFIVPNGTGRTFTIEAQDNYGNKPYTGSTVSDLTGTDVSLGITMVEDVNAAITAKMYQYFKDTIEPKQGTLTTADLEPFYAQGFGLNDGIGRASFIGRDWEDYNDGMFARGLSSLSVTATPSPTDPAKMIVNGRVVFNDGSYGFPDDGLVMVKEKGEWRITGNGYKSSIDFRGLTARWLSDPVTERVEAGFIVRIEDNGNFGLLSAKVEGPGLPAGGITFTKDPFFPKAMKLDSTFFPAAQLPTMQYETYVMSDTALDTIAANAKYTFTIYDSNGQTEQREFALGARPWKRSEVAATPTLFPAASVPSVSAATDGYYFADARIGGILNASVAAPTGFTSSWLSTALDYQGWNSFGQRGFFEDKELLLSDTLAAIDTSSTFPLIALGGNFSVTAEDFTNRREIKTIWMFKGPLSTVEQSDIIFFGTTPSSAGMILSPTTGTKWQFGSSPPVITWDGTMLGATGVEIFLLADDPQRLAFTSPSGNPFPGTRWVRLTPTVWPGSSGSFTLAQEVEKLGIAGSGCRVMIVSTLGDMWALSAPFTISP